ncbi:hypothetical protein APUTEX25_000848 [Auxenochlorella protothecoides]|uniref:PHD-type domain-containing protein n=1 Tax=Auxenochlorella protothecoides TaxID=3075 RepID=A0A3M7KSA1_AUXPR|nr:hypothetical protein APUTEX25_000848 [Auxenochlorella protothecoides]|eukprot:RMZ52729.1 hypothetical protein APUTEX25_000848 [Auxenochlorella protothecoides]
MKGVSGWLLALPEGPTLQVFREETGPGSLADPTSLAAIAAASARGRALALAQTALASPPPDDPAAQSYTAPASVFECPRHVLHGMVHGNGYGHLLRVNGVEGQGGAAGSGPRISGRTVMLLWTQLCARLAATAISTEDVSNKGGMDLRVLHTAAHLSTWYGQFGFDFGRGAYNITREQWAEAARAVHAAPLRSLVDDFHCVDDAVVGIVQRYGLPMEEPEVGVRASPATVGPLLQRMLRLSSSAGDARAFFDERAVAAARAAAVASALAAAAPARGGKGRPTATTRGKRGAPAGEVARKRGAGEAVVPEAGRQAAGGMVRGPLGPPPGSHIRVYIKSRRTYYNVCVLDARQPDGAARAPEYQVQYHSGATEWMGLEDIAWTHVAKSREALGCLAAFEQHLGCKRCSGGPPGCAYCWKAALADLREGRLGSERAEGKTKSQLIKSSSPPGAGRARGGGGGAPARGHTGGQLAFRAPCAECGGAACSSHDDAMVDGSTGSSEQGHAPAAEGLGAWLVPFRHPTGAPATDAGGAPPATATPAAAPRVPAAAAPGHDLAEGSQKDGARCQPSVFGEGHTSAVVSPAGEQLPLVPGGCSPAGGSDKGVARAQVLRDLRYLYEAVLTGRGPAAARVLRDCKLFVRDVRPAWAPPPSGMLRVALSAQLPPNFQLAHSRTRPSPRKGTASPVVASSAPNNHHPSHTSPPTPATAMRQLPLAPAPLALDLPADIDLGGTALAFTAALGEAYVAFQNYVPLILLPSPGASGWKAVPAATDATRLATVLPETACSAEAGGLRLLWMGGKGLDRNPAWWRQGGHEDWVVACSCGTRDDDGERMLSCDACGRWHHWRCAGLAEADPDPAAWQCPSCSPG